MGNIKTLGAIAILSGTLVAQGVFAQESAVLVTENNAESLGVDYSKVAELFTSYGHEVKRGDQFLIGVHEEDGALDLSTLDGISISIPIDVAAGRGVDAPRNLV